MIVYVLIIDLFLFLQIFCAGQIKAELPEAQNSVKNSNSIIFKILK